MRRGQREGEMGRGWEGKKWLREKGGGESEGARTGERGGRNEKGWRRGVGGDRTIPKYIQ